MSSPVYKNINRAYCKANTSWFSNAYSLRQIQGCAFYVLAAMGITIATGISNWKDESASAKDVSQAVAGSQPALESAAGILGQPTSLWTGAEQLKAATAADWTYCHDGTGFTAIFLVRQTGTGLQCHLATCDGGSAEKGFYFALNTTTNVAEIFFCNGTAGQFLLLDSAGGSIATNTTYVVTITNKLGNNPDVVIRVNGTQIKTGNWSTVPSALAPKGALSLGHFQGSAVATNRFQGRQAEIAFWNRLLSAAEITWAERTIGRRYGITVA